MSEESRYDLSQDRRPVLWTAAVGCAWSGTMRGLLTAQLVNGETRVAAECSTPDCAAELAKKLNLANLGSAAQMRNVTARRKLKELRSIVEMVPGTDNKNNLLKTVDWLLEQFLDEPEVLAVEREAAVLVHS